MWFLVSGALQSMNLEKLPVCINPLWMHTFAWNCTLTTWIKWRRSEPDLSLQKNLNLTHWNKQVWYLFTSDVLTHNLFTIHNRSKGNSKLSWLWHFCHKMTQRSMFGLAAGELFCHWVLFCFCVCLARDLVGEDVRNSKRRKRHDAFGAALYSIR